MSDGGLTYRLFDLKPFFTGYTHGLNIATAAFEAVILPKDLGMKHISRSLGLAALFIGLAIFHMPSSVAQTVVDDWTNIKTPSAPTLKPVTLDPKTTALLVMDLIKQACNEQIDQGVSLPSRESKNFFLPHERKA